MPESGMTTCRQLFSKGGAAVDWKPAGLRENAAAGVMTTCTRRKLRAGREPWWETDLGSAAQMGTA